MADLRGNSPVSRRKRLAILLILLLVLVGIGLIWIGRRTPGWLPGLLGQFSRPDGTAVLPVTTPTGDAIQPSISPSFPGNVATPAPSASSTVTALPLMVSPEFSTEISPSTMTPAWSEAYSQGLAVIAMDENGYSRLFAYLPGSTPLVRLTAGEWDDIDPALSPDGSLLAFASNRSGVWDLYLLEISTGELMKLTETPEYEAHPSWSPDGQWMAYECYTDDGVGNDNLDIFIRLVDGSQEAIRLTDDAGADFDPVWSPGGRLVAFVSTRSGEPEIWLANLDQIEDRFTNVSRSRSTPEMHPVWSSDGSMLVWSVQSVDNLPMLVKWQIQEPEKQPQPVSAGSLAALSPDGRVVLAALKMPNLDYLTGYSLSNQQLALPMAPLPGAVTGLTWGRGGLPDPLPPALAETASLSPAPLWVPTLGASDTIGKRMQVVFLDGVQPTGISLQDGVDEAYSALRKRLTMAVGWDYLATLDSGFNPLTAPMMPGMIEDWSFTGRAMRVSSAPMNADWMVIVRQDYGSQIFWRIYLRARFQDGSQGAPLDVLPWDLSARHSGDPLAYERGGALSSAIPTGYWVDFTRLAAAFGWERQPALSAWRVMYTAARYNEYILRDGHDWYSAMLELYPQSALNTPTAVLSPTPTATITITPSPTITPTRTKYPTKTPTATATRRPTLTPTPSKQP